MEGEQRQTFRSLSKSGKSVSLNDSPEIYKCDTLLCSNYSTSSDDDSALDYSGKPLITDPDCWSTLNHSNLVSTITVPVSREFWSDFEPSDIVQTDPISNHDRTMSVPNLVEERMKHSDEEVRQMRIKFLTLARNRALFRQMGRNQKCALTAICLTYLLSSCAISVLEPFFFEVAVLHNISTTTYSLIFSVHPFIIFCTSPFIGHILPTIGPKFMFVCGVFIFGTCNIIFGTLEYVKDDSQFVILCFLVRGMAAVGTSAFSTAGATFVADCFPDKVSVVMGVLETFIGLGLSIGPVVGGAIYTVGGFRLPFYTLGVIIISTLPFSVYMLPSPEQWVAPSVKGPKLYKIFKNPAVCIVCLVIVASSSAWSVLEPTLVIHMKQFNLPPVHLGLLFLLTSASYTISSPFWGWLSDKYDHGSWMMIIGLSFTSLSLLLLGPTSAFSLPNVLWLNMIALIMLGFFVALAYLPTYQALLHYALEHGCDTEINTYSIIAGLWASMYSLGEVMGPFIGGLLIDFYDFPMAMTCVGFANLGVALLLLFYQFYLCWLDRSKRRATATNLSENKPSNCNKINSDISGPQPIAANNLAQAEEFTSLLSYSNSYIYGTSSCP